MNADWLVGFGLRLAQAASGGALALATGVVGVAFIVDGAPQAAAAAIGAAVTLLFFALGHTVQVLLARRRAEVLLVAALTSYAAQVVLATVLISAFTARGHSATWLFAGLAAATAGWTTGLVLAFRHARIPVFDPTNEPPVGHGMTSGASPDRFLADERSDGQ